MIKKFIGKTLFFPEKGILAVGDLHIGYETALRQSGILIPERQVEDIIKDLKKIFETIEKQNSEVKKIVFIGDIKHAFGFEAREKNEFQKVLDFLGEFFPAENIILIKGNHDTIDYTFEGKLKDYHIEEDLAFVHGDRRMNKVLERKVNTIVMGHLHPCVILEEGAKKETYKCFLSGKYKNQNFIVLPSFLDIPEGTLINEFNEYFFDDFSIIPQRALKNFSVLVIGKNKVYEFGKVRDFKY